MTLNLSFSNVLDNLEGPLTLGLKDERGTLPSPSYHIKKTYYQYGCLLLMMTWFSWLKECLLAFCITKLLPTLTPTLYHLKACIYMQSKLKRQEVIFQFLVRKVYMQIICNSSAWRFVIWFLSLIYFSNIAIAV